MQVCGHKRGFAASNSTPEFCATTRGKPICENGQVLLLRVNESESLGPMAARYFASKLYRGETYYLQVHAQYLHNVSIVIIHADADRFTQCVRHEVGC
jgi:hypothetical protein